MSHRPVIGFHVVMTCYGFWLPNDPRGSGSWEVWSDALRVFGPATHVDSQRSVAKRPHDINVRRQAKRALKREPVVLNGAQCLFIAQGFRKYLADHQIECYACSVMPEHVHLVLARPRMTIERTMTGLKAASVHRLIQKRLHPFQSEIDAGAKVPKMWARDGRHIFLLDDADVWRSIKYVEDNPTFSRLPRQEWSFVVSYKNR